MKVRTWLLGFATLVATGVAVALAATVATAMPQGQATFSDPVGDSRGGPDVTTVAIDGDAPSGTIKVTVTAPGFLPATPDAFQRAVRIWLDTDLNRATGDPADGTEYGLSAWNDSSGVNWNMTRWNGSDWEYFPQTATQSFARSRSGELLAWTLNKSDVGGATGFRFYVHACTWDTAARSHVAEDEAPDSGWWDYALGAAAGAPVATPAVEKVALRVFAPQTTPRAAVAGKRFTVSFLAAVATEEMVTRVGADGITTVPMTTLRFVTGGRMVCDPSVQGRVIAHSESFKGGEARLSFLVPRSAKGKLLTVKVKLTVKDSGPEGSGKTLTASRVATFRVK